MNDPFFKPLGPGDLLDVTPHVGHVHSVDLPTDRGINTWQPVSIANDSTGERFRITPNTSIGEADAEYRRLMGQ